MIDQQPSIEADDRKRVEETRSPLVAHLGELRQRLLYSILGLALGFAVCFYFAEYIYAFLVAPYAHAVEGEEGRRLIFTALHETFFTYVKLSFWAAICLSFPIIASQIYMFVAPGLYAHEKKAFLPFLIATPILFVAGGSLVYYVIMPVAIEFFLSFESQGAAGSLPIELEAKVGEYLGLVTKLIFAFGLSFQLPIVLTLLARIGVIDSAWLKRQRKYAIVITFAAAAFLTPPDPISQIGLALPILILYELSILSAGLIEKRRNAQSDDSDHDAEV